MSQEFITLLSIHNVHLEDIFASECLIIDHNIFLNTDIRIWTCIDNTNNFVNIHKNVCQINLSNFKYFVNSSDTSYGNTACSTYLCNNLYVNATEKNKIFILKMLVQIKQIGVFKKIYPDFDFLNTNTDVIDKLCLTLFENFYADDIDYFSIIDNLILHGYNLNKLFKTCHFNAFILKLINTIKKYKNYKKSACIRTLQYLIKNGCNFNKIMENSDYDEIILYLYEIHNIKRIKFFSDYDIKRLFTNHIKFDDLVFDDIMMMNKDKLSYIFNNGYDFKKFSEKYKILVSNVYYINTVNDEDSICEYFDSIGYTGYIKKSNKKSVKKPYTFPKILPYVPFTINVFILVGYYIKNVFF